MEVNNLPQSIQGVNLSLFYMVVSGSIRIFLQGSPGRPVYILGR